ncbi:MAG: hypothetical protein JNL62_23725, partial [Bryobacterales bacterium]|nr:hypothetical protein [Bryobacterales bacterium]
AVGAALACPGRKVINMEGDGSSMYTIQALWTQAREKLDVLDQHMTQLLNGLSISAEPPAPVQIPTDWQTASQDILFTAKTLERNMGILLGGASGESVSPAYIQSLLRQLRTKLSSYETAANTAQ